MIGDGGGLFRVGVTDAVKLRKKPTRAKKAAAGKSETSLHWHVAGYLDKHLAAPAWFTTFPAGGGGEMRGKILKGLGLKSGVPDILIIFPTTLTLNAFGASFGAIPYSVVVPLLYWIELKKEASSGEPSAVQITTQQRLIEMGCRVANCNSMDGVKAALREWGLPYQENTPTEIGLRNSLKLALANV